MNIVALLSNVLGYNLIPLVFFIIGILLAKKSSVGAWILFGVGAGLGLLALIGSGNTIAMASGRVDYDLLNLMKLQYGLTWGVFVLFVIIAVVNIRKRSN